MAVPVTLSGLPAVSQRELTGSAGGDSGFAFFEGWGSSSYICFLLPKALAENPGVCEAGVYDNCQDINYP